MINFAKKNSYIYLFKLRFHLLRALFEAGFSVRTYAMTGVGLLNPDFMGDGWIAPLLREGVILVSDPEVSDRFGDVNFDGVDFPAEADLRLKNFYYLHSVPRIVALINRVNLGAHMCLHRFYEAQAVFQRSCLNFVAKFLLVKSRVCQ